MAPTRATANNCRWWRDYFIDHPGLKSKLADASTGTGQLAKAKVYCNKCFENHVNAVLGEDQLDVVIVAQQVWRLRRLFGHVWLFCR
jgi:hypothetical protein